ncbi:MAG: hypothetical protein AAB919_02140 [Patescibacteria group bacterium]
MKASSAVAVVVAIIVIAGAVWWIMAQPATPAPAETSAVPNTTQSAPVGTPAVAMVFYSAEGFSPSTVTVAKGDTVTFTAAAGTMWVGSAQHPSHTGYDGTTRQVHCAAGYSGPAPFDQCAAGTSFSFTFDKTGTWPYHDHIDSSKFGRVIVE